jgi:Tetratricopeptide repeat
MRSLDPVSLLLILSSLTSTVLRAQENPAPPPPAHIESQQELTDRLSPTQKQQYDDANKSFNAQDYATALSIYRLMLKELPGDPILSKFASEAALNTGDTTFALEVIKPVAQSNPDDWQAAALLTRACAEYGDKTCRDSGITHMLDLHKRSIIPSHTQQYVIERVTTSGKSLIIYSSLEPWGHYQVYNYAQMFDESGHLQLRLTIESDDTDQAFFAQQHAKEAAAGLRSFSLDGYQDSGLNDKKQRTETHYTFKFFVGQPNYETVRDAFVNIANGQTKPVSSRVNVLSQ